MTDQNKNQEKSVTTEIIRRVHLTLAELKSGEEALKFLRATEPVFMDEVGRFIKTEMSRMKFQLTESQALYIGSVIGATYIAGFLIAREADHEIYDGLINIRSIVKSHLTQSEIDGIIDSSRDEGKSYKEISKLIKSMLLSGPKKKHKSKEKKKVPKKNTDGSKLDIGDLS